VPEEGDRTVIRPLNPQDVAGPLFAGRYALLKTLGRGGMGTVYQARDSLVGDMVALKMLELGKEASPESLERFRREVRLARRITHPHVARMHDLGSHEGQAYLTMEYVQGEDLRTLLARKRSLTAPHSARIALAVCEGLAAAHAADVVHRDLKPANVLLESEGRVVLTDFGIARALAREAAVRTLGAIGTPLYMAPEQVAGEPVDARADLYAVGLLLYEMLTGETPFASDEPWAVAMARLRQPAPDLRGRPNIPGPLAGLVHRCLARAPEERPASASETARELRDWLASEGQLPVLAHTLQAPVMPQWVSLPEPPPTPPRRVTPRPAAASVTRGLAILPLRFQGPRESEFLAEALTETLIDQLSRARGFRVLGSGVTARFRDARDPRTVGSELKVELVVDGTVQSTGRAVRVSIRLLEARSGTQLWSGSFESASTEVFEIQDKLMPRIAEELRGEGVLATWRASLPPEVLALYRQANQQIYGSFWSIGEGPLALLDRCLELAPDFVPAISLHAIASLRTWFMGTKSASGDLAKAARDSIERALHLAPDMVGTHLARAMLAAQENDWRLAVMSVRTALDIAPFHAPSMQYLGNMQCESGHADEGLVRLRLAYELCPTLVVALYEFARCSALRGQMEDYRWALERLATAPTHRAATAALCIRVAAWNRDLEELRRHREATSLEGSPISLMVGLYAATLLGELPVSELIRQVDEPFSQNNSPRFISLMCQLTTEVLCLCDEAPKAMGFFQRAADTVLIDLEWIEHCPALQPLRALPGFADGRRKVRARVEAIWSG
jgi:serine/threonine protein kinase